MRQRRDEKMKLYHAQAESFGTVYDKYLVAENEEQARDIAYHMGIFEGFSKGAIDVNEITVEGYDIQIKRT